MKTSQRREQKWQTLYYIIEEMNGKINDSKIIEMNWIAKKKKKIEWWCVISAGHPDVVFDHDSCCDPARVHDVSRGDRPVFPAPDRCTGVAAAAPVLDRGDLGIVLGSVIAAAVVNCDPCRDPDPDGIAPELRALPAATHALHGSPPARVFPFAAQEISPLFSNLSTSGNSE